MKVAITINDVLRNFYSTFTEIYNVYVEEEEAFNNELTTNDFQFGVIGEDGEVDFDSQTDNLEKKILNLPNKYDSMGLTEKFAFESIDDFYNFMYESMAFEIFAKTNVSYKGVMEDFHELQSWFNSKNIQVDLVSVEKFNSKPATLFFLSREKCKLNNLKFVESYDRIWNDYQMVITAENFLIENKPTRRKLFKIETPNNKHLTQGTSVVSLKEVLNIIKK